MKKEMNEETKAFNAELAKQLASMKEEFNGCPLFEGREKGNLDDIVSRELTIEDLFPLNDYHCVVFEEVPDMFYLTGGALKDLCNNYAPEFVRGRVIEIQPLVKTKNRRDFRPIRVIA